MAKNRKYIFIGGAILLAIAVLSIVFFTASTTKNQKYYEVKKGNFEAVLSCKGEIKQTLVSYISRTKDRILAEAA